MEVRKERKEEEGEARGVAKGKVHEDRRFMTGKKREGE